MAYQTYITEALVCGSYDSQSADRSFLLFTREAGMLFAHAKSVREERSKQRYALQVCAHVRATLIRGKSGWKITGAESIQNLYTHMETREARAFLRNTVLLLRRVIHGEIAHTEIFDDVIAACVYVRGHQSPNTEKIIALRILHTLGYIAAHQQFEPFLHMTLLSALETPVDDVVAVQCTEAIGHALMQSQL